MLTRSLHTTTVGRSASMRRLRRRQAVSATRLFCSTNGCASFLVLDVDGHVAVCPVCGFSRRVS